MNGKSSRTPLSHSSPAPAATEMLAKATWPSPCRSGRNPCAAHAAGMLAKAPSRAGLATAGKMEAMGGVKVAPSRAGQSATEMLVMTGVAIAFILPLALLFFTTSSSRAAEVSKLQAQGLAQKIADEAARVCYQDWPSKRVVLVNYPQRLLNISVVNKSVVATLEAEGGGINEILAQSACNMTDAISPATGQQVPGKALSAVRGERYVSSGLVALVFFNNGYEINIYRVVGNDYSIS